MQNQQMVELQAASAAVETPPPSNEPAEPDQELLSKVSELENDRHALEEELENIRARAVDMSQIIADQKRQMAEDQSQWMAEFRQLRRILDKQTKWITQQTDLSNGRVVNNDKPTRADSFAVDGVMSLDCEEHAESPNKTVQSSRTVAGPQQTGGNHTTDPVLGSVLSQFEFLQKDVARRRKQNGNGRVSKPSAPPEK